MTFDAMPFDPRDGFGPAVAATYDDEPRGDEDACVAFLAGLAGGGPALELAVGTGRIALPLAARGIDVEGIELSSAMIEVLRAKPGGAALPVTEGDMASVVLSRTFGLVFVVFNSLMNLVTQDDQVRCLANAARHLTAGGVLVVENLVPDPMYDQRERDGALGSVNPTRISADGVRLEVDRYDRVTQRLDLCHVGLSPAGITVEPLAFRHVWPSELDLMARLAGLRLRERRGGWRGEPFDARSTRHVSVYGRAT